MIDSSGVTLPYDAFWNSVKSMLTENQWKWVQFYLIDGIPLQEIAQQEGVSEDAVKSWGRQTRRKLKDEKETLVRLYKYRIIRLTRTSPS